MPLTVTGSDFGRYCEGIPLGSAVCGRRAPDIVRHATETLSRDAPPSAGNRIIPSALAKSQLFAPRSLNTL